MGIQVIVSKNDLVKAGCQLKIVNQTQSPIEFGEDGEVIRVIEWHDVQVTFPNGERFVFDKSSDSEKVWADFNDWGSNLPILEKLFDLYKIEHFLV